MWLGRQMEIKLDFLPLSPFLAHSGNFLLLKVGILKFHNNDFAVITSVLLSYSEDLEDFVLYVRSISPLWRDQELLVEP